MAVRIQIRSDTAARWAQYNPVLADNELAYEKDTGKMKIGNGRSRWKDLPYIAFTEGIFVETWCWHCGYSGSTSRRWMDSLRGVSTYYSPFVLCCEAELYAVSASNRAATRWYVNIYNIDTRKEDTILKLDTTYGYAAFHNEFLFKQGTRLAVRAGKITGSNVYQPNICLYFRRIGGFER